MSEFAFVLGNGKTRLLFDPNDLKLRGTVYACNRAYQDFTPDVLVSVDRLMAQEIQCKHVNSQCVHYTREQNIIPGSTSLAIDMYSSFSSGPVAVSLAARQSYHYIFMIGMDLHSEDERVNNIYADQEFYKTSADRATAYDNWISQIREIALKFNHSRFVHVNPLKGFTPDQWKTLLNFSIMNLHEFKLMINN